MASATSNRNIRSKAKFLSLHEIQKYIGAGPQDNKQYLQYILRGWRRFVVPFTPPPKDDGLASPDPFPDTVLVLLSAISHAVAELTSLNIALDPMLIVAWPTMWTWIQILYEINAQARCRNPIPSEAFLQEKYTVIIQFFYICTRQNPPNEFSDVIAETAGALTMMAELWVREGRDKNRVFGFPAACLAKRFVPLESRLLDKFVLVCGTPEEVVHVAFQRIELNLGQTQRDYPRLTEDLAFILSHMTDCSALHTIMLAHPAAVPMVIRTMTHVLSPACTTHVTDQRDMLFLCVFIVLHLARFSPHAYDHISNLLRNDFLLLLIRSVPLYRPDESRAYRDFTKYSTSVLGQLLPPFLVYRPILSLARRSVSAIQKRFPKPLPNQSIRNAWVDLVALVEAREKLYEQYQDRPRSVFVCGNVECKTADSDALLRCAGCALLRYCSKTCQRRHWTTHRLLCKDMQHNFADAVGLSNPDLDYLSYVVAYDLSVKYKAITIEMRNRYLDIRAGSARDALPMLQLSYVLKPGFMDISTLEAQDDNAFCPFSDQSQLQLHEEWCRAIRECITGETVPVLVFLPRGEHHGQTMTALLTTCDSIFEDDSNEQEVGIRWLHYK